MPFTRFFVARKCHFLGGGCDRLPGCWIPQVKKNGRIKPLRRRRDSRFALHIYIYMIIYMIIYIYDYIYMIIYIYTYAYTSYTNQTNQCSVGYEYVSIKLTTSKINKSHIQPFGKISQVCLLLISCWFNQSIILGHVLFTSELPFTRLGMSTSL